MKKYDVAIIGAGTAGLVARNEVAKKTDRYVVFDGGVLGTTCAWAGCMPSKALIEMANAYHQRMQFKGLGLSDTDNRRPDYQTVMQEVRRLRDKFSDGVKSSMETWQDKFVRKNVRFTGPNTLSTGGETIRADKIIVASGASSFLPEDWNFCRSCLVDSDQFFNLEILPDQMTVFGLGPIGLEIGQALSRLGVKVLAVTRNKRLGGLSDPELQEFAVDTFSRQIELYQGTAEIRQLSGNEVQVGCADKQWPAQKVLTAMGRKPNIRSLGLENLNVPLDQNGMPEYDRNTLNVIGAPVFFAGDVNRDTPLLHEATDEGRIAGINAVADKITGFQRRVPLEITFSSPNIVKVGKFHNTLIREKTDFVTGKAVLPSIPGRDPS